MTVHRTIELDDAVDAQLQAIASYENLSPEEAMKKVLAERIDYDRWLHAAVEEGRASIARGDVMDQEEVFAQLYERMAKASPPGE